MTKISNTLIVYPTSRALRVISKEQKLSDGMLPTLMRMDEFEQRSVLLGYKSQVDLMERILLLKKAASFDAFAKLKLNLDLVRFFTRSDAVFKFFEELAVEKVEFNQLKTADAYAEFEEHLNILQILLERYEILLEERGWTDRAFLPKRYTLNDGFIANYEMIEIYIEGYLSRFEFELLEAISQKTKMLLHFTTGKFTAKMQERFGEIGVELPDNAQTVIDLSNKQIVSCALTTNKIIAKVIATHERYEQIALAFAAIEEMVRSGIEADKIALVLPDEKFKESFALYDKYHNLNFAMGYDYAKGKSYKTLEAIRSYWHSFERKDRMRLQRYGIDMEKLGHIHPAKKVSIDQFFTFLDEFGLLDCPLQEGEALSPSHNAKVYEKYLVMNKIFTDYTLVLSEWLIVWMNAAKEITIDDVRGGKVTVMGALETRGVAFDGVVVVDFNEGITPALPGKDQFLNSAVRAFAGLPTKDDREALQKQLYKRLLEQAKQAVILYSTSDNKLPSKFLYELGLGDVIQAGGQLSLLYDEPSGIVEVSGQEVPEVPFDATSVVWSPSRLRTFLECKRKYYHKYIQHIKAKQDEEINEGLFAHQLLQAVFEQHSFYTDKFVLGNEIARQLDISMPDISAKGEYRKLLLKAKLKSFVDAQITYFAEGWKVIEKEFEIDGEIGGLRFKGRIDRIDQNGTDILVLDYKTGRIDKANQESLLETLSDFQMSIYHQLLLPKYQNIRLAFVKLFDGGDIEDIRALEEKNELLFAHIEDLKDTKVLIAGKCEDLKLCKYCEFALMCERGEYL